MRHRSQSQFVMTTKWMARGTDKLIVTNVQIVHIFISI